MAAKAKFKIGIKVIKSLTIFLFFLLLLPLHSAFSAGENPTIDNQHTVNGDATHQDGYKQSSALPTSPAVTPVEPNKPWDDGRMTDEMHCQKDFTTWKGCVQVRIRVFSRRLPRIEETEGGVVRIRFKYDEEGIITNVEVTRSSGDEKLNQHAVALFQRMKTIPKPITGGGTLTVPIQFPKVEKKQPDTETHNNDVTRDPSSQK